MYLTQGLHKSMHVRPDATAVRFMDKELTYAQLGDRVARLAGALRKLGINDGDRVAMYSLNSLRYIEYDLAVPWAGGVLNPVNIRWSAAEILYSLDDSGTTVMIVDDAFKAAAAGMVSQAKTVRHLVYAGDGETPEGMLNYEALIAESEPIEDAWRHGGDLAGIFYTGGTTGFPKGVMLSHDNLGVSAVNALIIGSCIEKVRYLHAMPMFHLADFAPTVSLFMSGGTHIVIPMFEPKLMLETISRERVTETLMAPTLIQMTLDWIDQHPAEAAELDLSSLNHLTYGASPISQTLLERARAAFPNVAFYQGYGMTELAPVGALLFPEHHHGHLLRAAGRAATTVEMKIVDPQGVEVPRGTAGEIVARGPNVMLGYWNKPEETAKALRNGWMHTGDGGHMDDEGFVYIGDRIKDMIITGGENVYSTEVENAVAAHPGVAQCAVIGIPSERWGESVHAVLVLKEGATLPLDDLRTHCRERIATYKVPRSMEVRTSLPVSGVGKVLKTDLRKSASPSERVD
ncbi:long-chain fatty acid--CoA ligase [Variovorax sp. dw_308]|uniref:acyl-CoA synthetase n=1 Tax=Variovorax sp. dw_308 TaxID=2721546 RepID=UPI001C466DAF|nr:long-chain fatty acid--CoA ligase [Variovorax sp. dw_308]